MVLAKKGNASSLDLGTRNDFEMNLRWKQNATTNAKQHIKTWEAQVLLNTNKGEGPPG